MRQPLADLHQLHIYTVSYNLPKYYDSTMFAFHIAGLIAAVAAAASAAPAQVSSSGSLTWAVPGTAPVATPLSYTEPVRQNATGSIGPSVTLYRRDKSTPSEAPAIYFSSGSLTWAVPATAPVFTPPSYTSIWSSSRIACPGPRGCCGPIL